MHELSVATELHAVCRAEVARRGGGRLRRATVDLGELSGVEPDLLRFAWPAVTAGTVDDGATIEIRWREARQSCTQCGTIADRQPGTWLRLCPRCERPLRVEGGDELELATLEFEPLSDRLEVTT